MESAKQNRTAAKVWVTRVGNQVVSACDKKESVLTVNALVSEFRGKVERLDSAQVKVESLIPPEELETDIEAADTYYHERVRLVYQKANAYLASVTEVDDDLTSVSSSQSGHAEAKLPKITLPEFFGDATEWPTFWDLFEANVDSTDMSAIVKFSYLNTLLKGDARAVTSGLKLTAVNYPVAVSLLRNRYGRPDRIIFQHIEALLNIEATSNPSVAQLWTMLDTLQTHIRSLEAHGITGSQFGVILTPLVLSRLPASLRLQWVRESERMEKLPAGGRSAEGASASALDDSKPPIGADLAFLLDFLEQEIRRREMSHVYTGMRGGQLDATTSPASASVLHSAGGKVKPSGCGVCSKKHPTAQCPTLAEMTVDERRETLKENNICMKCLAKSSKEHRHNFSRCKSKCAQCQKYHHKLICPPSSPSSQPQSDKQEHSFKKASTCTSSSTLSSSDFSASHSSVLLKTICVSVKGKRGKEVKANILFDTGADRTYISKKLVDQIMPEWIESTMISFASFGADAPSDAIKRDVYSVWLGGECVRATCVPHICAPIYQPSIPHSILQSMPGLIEAKPGETLTIDLLVGMDCYWRLMTGKTKFLTPNLAAQKSKLGWIVSGNVLYLLFFYIMVKQSSFK